jgi:chemotaxis protein methyltransferase CheR
MSEREFKFERAEFQELRTIVYDRTGINLKDNKEQMVYTRLARRIRALGQVDFAEYLRFLNSADGEAEVTDFVNAMTTNLTRFFREDHHFQHLRHEVIKSKVEGNRVGLFDKNLRIWSAGCSKGMEPYSIAMIVKASLPQGEGWYTKILATDIDTNMLDVGRSGVYRARDCSGIPPALEKRFVRTKGEDSHMSQELKDMIHFKYLNFMDEWPIKTKFDAIFCRNVMIYFDHETQERLINRFVNLLEDHGILYVGHAEALVANHPRLASVGRSSFRIKNDFTGAS